MKQNDIDKSLRITDIENFFQVSEQNGFYRYNLNETIYMNIDNDKVLYYTLKTNAFWTLISYKIYKTTRLAWLLMKLNNVKGKDIFKMLEAGQTVKYISVDDVNSIIELINN